MEEYIKLNTVSAYEKLILFFLAVLFALAGMYFYKMISFLLPLITFILITFEGGIKNISLKVYGPFVLLALLLTWSGLSIFWAENQWAALSTFTASAFTFTVTFLFFSCLTQATPYLCSKAYTLIKISGFFFILLIISQVYINTFLNDVFLDNVIKYKSTVPYMLRMKPTGSILGLLSFVGCGFLWVYNNKTVAIATFLLIFLLIILTLCQTAVYSIIIATIIFGFSYLWPFFVARIGMIFSYAFLLNSPLLYAYVITVSQVAESPHMKWLMNSSFFHRFLAWEYYSKKFFEKPFFGWGVESSRYLPTDLELAPGYNHLLHPHNSSIQAYAELGFIGGGIYALFFSSLFYLVGKNVKDRLSVAVCNATITFGFIGAEVTHNAWRNYWLSLAAITAGLIILLIRAREAQLHVQAGHLTQPLIQTKEWELQQSCNS